MMRMMKKMILTFVAVVAVSWGAGTGFAQSSHQKDCDVITDSLEVQMDDSTAASMQAQESRLLGVYDLPELVLEHLKYSDLAGHTIISVAEVPPRAGEDDAPLQYELMLHDSLSETAHGPLLLVRFDAFGELISRKEVPFMAQQEKQVTLTGSNPNQ